MPFSLSAIWIAIVQYVGIGLLVIIVIVVAAILILRKKKRDRVEVIVVRGEKLLHFYKYGCTDTKFSFAILIPMIYVQ